MKTKEHTQKQLSTIALKISILLIGSPVLAICVLVLPGSLTEPGYYLPIVICLYLTALPFFYALHQAFVLLNLIDKNKAFTDKAVKVLRNIKYAAVIISAFYALGMPYIYYAAQMDDAPGVLAIGLIIAFASFVIAIAAALFQQLFQNAVKIKKENDLTV